MKRREAQLKDNEVRIRCSAEERQYWEQAAARMNAELGTAITLSGFVRAAANGTATRWLMWHDKSEKD